MNAVAGLIAGAILFLGAQLSSGEPVPAGPSKGESVVSQKSILVVYYSRSGNTKKAAGDIARLLNADTEQLIDKKDRSGAGGYMIACKDAAMDNRTELEPVKKDPAQYDLIILGTPVWCWDMAPALRTYIADHKSAFKAVAIFTTAGNTKPEKIAPKIEALAEKKAAAMAGFFESDLKEQNRPAYEEKLKAFVAAVQ